MDSQYLWNTRHNPWDYITLSDIFTTMSISTHISLFVFKEPPPPFNLRSSNADTTSITIRWSPPDPPHGVIIGYDVQYWKVNGSSANVIINDVTNMTAYTVTGLQVNDMLSIQVRKTSNNSWCHHYGLRVYTMVKTWLRKAQPSLPVVSQTEAITWQILRTGKYTFWKEHGVGQGSKILKCTLTSLLWRKSSTNRSFHCLMLR